MAGRRSKVVMPDQRLARFLPVVAGVLAITPAVYSQVVRLTLGLVAMPLGGDLRLNPEGNSLFEAGRDWPPAPWSSLPFWVSAIGLGLVALHLLRRRDSTIPYMMRPWVLAFWCGLSAGYAWVFGGLFIRSADWPRDSRFAAGVFLSELVVYVGVGVILILRRKRIRLSEGQRMVVSSKGSF